MALETIALARLILRMILVVAHARLGKVFVSPNSFDPSISCLAATSQLLVAAASVVA